MDCHNRREGVREAKLDVEEGADVVMVKPALAYLDVIAAVREAVDVPVCAYNVSGEYSMVKAAAQKGWIDEKRTVLELTAGIRRAGADMVITYWAKDLAVWLREPVAWTEPVKPRFATRYERKNARRSEQRKAERLAQRTASIKEGNGNEQAGPTDK